MGPRQRDREPYFVERRLRAAPVLTAHDSSDAFADELTDKYGASMRDQVEERLKFFDSGETPRRNVDVMQEVAAQLRAERGEDVEMSEAPSSSKKDKKKKKRKEASGDVELLKAKKKKKKKKSSA